MARVTLIHWNAAEAKERAARLREAGHRVGIFSTPGGEETPHRKLRESPPDAFLIDLSRVPSHGGAMGTWLRQQKATRAVPLLFVGGEPAKVARVRKQIPDAVYTEWGRIRSALRKALESAPAKPVVPGTMAGYSGTPLPKKLGIKPSTVLTLIGAPVDFEKTLGGLPEGVSIRRQARGRAERVILFVKSAADLKKRLPAAKKVMAEGGGLWIAWPKQASGMRTDLTQIEVRGTGLRSGLVDYKICAIDRTWSGLCFARRRKK